MARPGLRTVLLLGLVSVSPARAAENPWASLLKLDLVSPDNIEHVKTSIVDGAIRVNGPASPKVAGARAAASAMERARAEGKTLWRGAKVQGQVVPAASKTPVNPAHRRRV